MPANAYAKPLADDDTVDSTASAEVAVPAAKVSSSSFKNRAKRQLTLVSAKYDLDGDGILDEAEQAMRDRDVNNRGFLTNEEIYGMVQEQLKAHRKASHMKRLVGGLICFVVLLALSNLGTSWASAALAKDLASDNQGDIPVMRDARTGELAAAQSTAETFEAMEMTDEEYAERRLSVLEEMEDDPHSHAHRRLGKKNKKSNKISFDSDWIDEREFDRIESQCKHQRNVNIKVRRGDSSLNQCVCSRGTSVVVKDKRNKKTKSSDLYEIGEDCPGCMGNGKKKGKNKNNNKKGGGNNKKKGGGNNNKKIGRNREVIIEQEDGRVLHADCNNGRCYCGGTTLMGELGDRCRIGTDECGHHRDGRQLVCEPEKSKGNNIRVTRSANSWGSCALPTARSRVIVDRIDRQERAGPGDVCVTTARDFCSGGYWCEPDDFDGFVRQMRSGAGGAGAGGYGGQTAVISGPSGTIVAGTGAGGAAMTPRSRSNTGSCARSAGAGQTCWDDAQCGPGGRCAGLNSQSATVIAGPSGTINVGGSTSSGICA